MENSKTEETSDEAKDDDVLEEREFNKNLQNISNISGDIGDSARENCSRENLTEEITEKQEIIKDRSCKIDLEMLQSQIIDAVSVPSETHLCYDSPEEIDVKSDIASDFPICAPLDTPPSDGTEVLAFDVLPKVIITELPSPSSISDCVTAENLRDSDFRESKISNNDVPDRLSQNDNENHDKLFSGISVTSDEAVCKFDIIDNVDDKLCLPNHEDNGINSYEEVKVTRDFNITNHEMVSSERSDQMSICDGRSDIADNCNDHSDQEHNELLDEEVEHSDKAGIFDDQLNQENDCDVMVANETTESVQLDNIPECDNHTDSSNICIDKLDNESVCEEELDHVSECNTTEQLEADNDCLDVVDYQVDSSQTKEKSSSMVSSRLEQNESVHDEPRPVSPVKTLDANDVLYLTLMHKYLQDRERNHYSDSYVNMPFSQRILEKSPLNNITNTENTIVSTPPFINTSFSEHDHKINVPYNKYNVDEKPHIREEIYKSSQNTTESFMKSIFSSGVSHSNVDLECVSPTGSSLSSKSYLSHETQESALNSGTLGNDKDKFKKTRYYPLPVEEINYNVGIENPFLKRKYTPLDILDSGTKGQVNKLSVKSSIEENSRDLNYGLYSPVSVLHPSDRLTEICKTNAQCVCVKCLSQPYASPTCNFTLYNMKCDLSKTSEQCLCLKCTTPVYPSMMVCSGDYQGHEVTLPVPCSETKHPLKVERVIDESRSCRFYSPVSPDPAVRYKRKNRYIQMTNETECKSDDEARSKEPVEFSLPLKKRLKKLAQTFEPVVEKEHYDKKSGRILRYPSYTVMPMINIAELCPP